MRFFILAVLILSSQEAFNQSDSLNVTIVEIEEGENESEEYLKACDDARQAAREDIVAGMLVVENYMGVGSGKRDLEFEEFYTNYLIVNYKIERVTTGCTTPREKDCYFEEMSRAIIARYDPLFLQGIKDIAKEEYEKFKLLNNEERRKYIDFDHAYIEVDERASYTAGMNDLQRKLRERIDFKKFNSLDYILAGFYAEVVIDETGNVVSCKVLSRNFPSDANEAVQKAVKEIGGWKAATLYDSKVKSKAGFILLF